MASQQQIDANRQNAQKSTGPKTPEGKAAVSLNALKHGLTAEQACISDEDEDEFDATLESFEQELQPVGNLETLLVQQIVMAAWRLTRLRAMETGLFDRRLLDLRKELATYIGLTPQFQHAYVFLSDVRGPNALTVLARYESRVERSFYRALHELQRLQAARPAPPDPILTKQSQIILDSAPNPEPQQDLTPSSSPSFVPLCLRAEPQTLLGWKRGPSSTRI